MSSSKRIALLENYIAEEPNEPFNHYALALEFIESDPKKAQDLMEKLVKNHASYLPTYYKYAHLLWETKQLEKAEIIFKTGIQIAEKQQELKALAELKSAYQNFQFDLD